MCFLVAAALVQTFWDATQPRGLSPKEERVTPGWPIQTMSRERNDNTVVL